MRLTSVVEFASLTPGATHPEDLNVPTFIRWQNQIILRCEGRSDFVHFPTHFPKFDRAAQYSRIEDFLAMESRYQPA